MTTDLKKTLAFVVAAVLLMGAAVVSSRDRSIRPEAFNDQGRKFFDDFDPNTATTLEVIELDAETVTPLPFKVTFKNGQWVIPSHYEYPADAKKRLVDTATGIVGLTKDAIASDRADDHEPLGVVDPTDTKVTGLKGFGKRVTLSDATGKVLADFLIGKEVKDHPDLRYVRVPGQKRTYAVNVKVDLSTRFADWIETNLLKLDASKARKVVIDHKSVDVANRRIVPGEVLTMTRADASAPWVVEGTPPGQETNTDTTTALTTALGDLKIAGIRPKPEGLTADLKQAPGEILPKTQQAQLSLINKGFYPTREGLLSTKGEVTVSTDEGVVYTLRYGEVVVAAGNELSAGTDDQSTAEKEAAKKDPLKAKQATSEGRYLFATATFDPALIPPPKPGTAPDDKFPDDPFAYATADDKRLTVPSPRAEEQAAKLQADRDRQVADGQKRVKELADRFSPWYYVTPGESYKTIVADRTNLTRPLGSKPAKPPGGPGMPNIPGLQGIPGLGDFNPGG